MRSAGTHLYPIVLANTSSVALELRGVGAGVTGFDATYPRLGSGVTFVVGRGLAPAVYNTIDYSIV
jgi:hypothetical protein